ncbi:hypothetical protein [Dyella sp. 20L07]|uniref:hypothetical protein n=1 Tax=Dyella sp. 20L07 TaxID=3384240 RepID=UPI003D26BEF3
MRLSQVLLGVFLACSSAATFAASPVNLEQGLGTAQPNTQNVSQSPGWRAYRFWKDGIEYIQVNDLSGQVRMGFGTANGLVVVLPLGVDASRVSSPNAPLSIPVTGAEVVYRDASATVNVGVNNTGQFVWTVVPTTLTNASKAAAASQSANCDPNDCPINRVTAATQSVKCDPNDCPINRVTTSKSVTCDPNDCPINRITSQ